MLKNIFRLDWTLSTAVLLLVGLSLAALYPISYAGGNFAGGDTSHFFRQVIFAVVGIAVFFLLLWTIGCFGVCRRLFL